MGKGVRDGVLGTWNVVGTDDKLVLGPLLTMSTVVWLSVWKNNLFQALMPPKKGGNDYGLQLVEGGLPGGKAEAQSSLGRLPRC